MQEDGVAMAKRIARLAAAQGGRVYYVGGCVRDRLLGGARKDVDVEVHGLTPRQLEAILDSLGERIAIGESFGVYALKGCALDIAMPRRETCRGGGHRDFEVCVDPFLGAEKAAARRDFTVNALMEDVLTGELIDPFGGAEDLKKGVLRHVSGQSFPEDPLRVLRAAQFAARFGFTVADGTLALCARMDLSGLKPERVTGELEKALLKAERPSVFFETLRRMGQLSVWFPEAEAVIGVKQDPLHHPEGDVWTHTMLVLDAAARLRGRAQDPFGFLLAALVHDFGKAVCSEETPDGRVHAYGHETKGLPLAEAFLRRLTREKALTAYVLDLTANHMRPNRLAAAGASVKATNRMFDRTRDAEGLLCLAEADSLGKGGAAGPDYGPFLRGRLAVYREYMRRPYVTGRDLIAAGLEPSARFSDYLAFAHSLRLAGVEKDAALRQTLARARKTENEK